MRFTNSELEMIYQYAAPTKAETIGGMKETVPVIKEGKAGGEEKRPAEKESQLAGATTRQEEQKKHCGNVHNRLWNHG